VGPDLLVNLLEAKTHLSSLVERAAEGKEIVIAKGGRPLARLVAYESRRPLVFGSLAGKIEVPDDFNSLASDEIATATMFYGPQP
jgi:prevent-host-death family protein